MLVRNVKLRCEMDEDDAPTVDELAEDLAEDLANLEERYVDLHEQHERALCTIAAAWIARYRCTFGSQRANELAEALVALFPVADEGRFQAWAARQGVKLATGRAS
jgi:hypothetical protein